MDNKDNRTILSRRQETGEKLGKGTSEKNRWSKRKRVEEVKGESYGWMGFEQMVFEGRTKGLIGIEGANGRWKRVIDRGRSIGNGMMTVCGIRPENHGQVR